MAEGKQGDMERILGLCQIGATTPDSPERQAVFSQIAEIATAAINKAAAEPPAVAASSEPPPPPRARSTKKKSATRKR